MASSLAVPSLAGTRNLRPSIAKTSSPSGPSYISLFLRNLRLLDLDQRDDWPGITEVTFSTKDTQQNQKKRIQCAEWALYHLFALWDPEEARNVRLLLSTCAYPLSLLIRLEATPFLPPPRTPTVPQSANSSLSMSRPCEERWGIGAGFCLEEDHAR